jgi:hypothetical protein
VEASGAEAERDLVAGHADGKQLPTSDHAMLAPGEGRD